MLQINDAEFQDWCSSNSHARFWYCSQVKNSPILQRAIKNSIQKSPHPQLETICDDLDDMQSKFVGVVTAQIQDKILKAFIFIVLLSTKRKTLCFHPSQQAQQL
jgi:hypothetical protein